MGSGASIEQPNKKGVRAIQALRAGIRLKVRAGSGQGTSGQGDTCQTGLTPVTGHDQSQSLKTSNLVVTGKASGRKKVIATEPSLKKNTSKPVTSGVSKTAAKPSKDTGTATKTKKKSVSEPAVKKKGGKAFKPTKSKGLPSKNEGPRSKLGQQIDKVLHGAVDIKCPVNTRIIRIFLSSTFTDTEHERNALMEQVYPKLKAFCQEKGYEFQMVDMRWGVRDEATDMHQTTELCLREIRACQQLSVGPNFITLLSEKYGYCPLMPTIAADEFDKLLSTINKEGTKELLLKWYKKDCNSIPVSFVLQPVTTWIPNYFSEENEFLKNKARNEWREDFQHLKDALVTAVRDAFDDKEKLHLYVRSVCEAELVGGLLEATTDSDKCGWLHRQFTGLPDPKKAGNHLVKYVDTCNGVVNGVDTKELLQSLKDAMKKGFQGRNVIDYNVQWTEEGIDPNEPAHKKYIETFCADFEGMVKAMILNNIAKYRTSAEINSPLYEEVAQQTIFCQSKLEMFHGRKDTLQNVLSYIRGTTRQPLVLYGRSGCGKTSIMAMLAKLVQEWTEKDACIVLRFLGTTPKSSTIRRVLRSVAQQIKCVYKLTVKVPQNTKDLVELFPTVLSSATEERPLVLLFDSLDQLSPEGGAWKLSWLPKFLPEHVKFVVSTLPDAEFRCFPQLKAMLKDPALFVAVPSLAQSDVSDILAKWLKNKNRTLQAEQLKIVEDAFSQCPLPLFLKISFDEACRWRSYMPAEQTRLHVTIRDAINSLFEMTERQHGEILVRHALGYLTAARSGLTTNELEDILSCDDEVLDDVFQYWTPPIRRLPPLLWVRIRADLESYLVDRGAEGARVTYWYHRQFKEAATDRYLSEEHQTTKLHSNMADYFLGRNAEIESSKETKTFHGQYVRSSSINAQPLKLSRHQYNLRKLHELPYHLICSKRWHELKTNVFCSYEWLEAKIRARSLRALLDDFHFAKDACVDPDIAAVREILQLGQDAILSDPSQLASQLVSRLYDRKVQDTSSLMKSRLSETLTTLLQQAHLPEDTSLLPCRAFLTPPGGQLVETLVGHKRGVYGLAATQDGACVVTGSQDGSLKVWSISDGSVLLTVHDLGEDIGTVKCCDDDKRIVVSSKRGLTVLDFDTGEILQSVEIQFFTSSPPFSLAGYKGRKVAFFTMESVKVVNIMTGQVEFVFKDIKPVGKTGQNSLISACSDTLLCNSKEEENSLKVLDVSSYKITHSFEVFDEEDDDNYLHLTEIVMKTEHEVLVAKKMRIDSYDVQSGAKLKSIRGKLDDWISHMSIIPELDMLVFPKREKVVVVKLDSGERQEVLEHSNYISRVLAATQDLIITSGGDSVIRVWDLSQEDVHRHVGKPETLLHMYPVSDDSRYVISVGRLGLGVHVITTWDLSTFLPVRKVSNISSSYIKVISERKAALRVENHAVIVDLNSWKVLCVLKGKLPDFTYAGTPDLCTVFDNSEILTYSFDQKSLKIYNIETGDQTGVLKGPRQQYRIQAFIVNVEGTVLAHNDEPLELIFIWNIIKREMLFEVNRAGYERFVLTLAAFTPDGNQFLLSVRRAYEDDYINHPSVWNVWEKKLVHDLRYDEDTDTHSLAVINNSRTVTSHKDMNIVVWDHLNGTAQYVLPSMHYGCRVDVLSSGGKFAISCDDKTIVLWDVEEGRQAGSFTVDKITAILPLLKGDVIALGYDSPLPFVVLRRQGCHLAPYECPTEGTRALGGADINIVFEGIEGKYVEDEEKYEIEDTNDEKAAVK